VTGYLLDTNVPSEFSRDRPEPHVVEWLQRQPVTTMFLSVVTIGEICKGLTVLPWAVVDPSSRSGSTLTC
jgi:predicted nucleic acid-binding protein